MFNRNLDATRTCTELSELPDEPHFIVLVEKTLTYDDGYGERGQSSTSTLRYLEHVVCLNQEALNAWVVENDARKYGAPEAYRIVRATPVQVIKQVHFEFEGA
jgi:hypothetical protein